jgi:2-methylisocitrate lyase-like PEP mutase family enzyme
MRDLCTVQAALTTGIDTMRLSSQLRELLRSGTTVAPGVFDGLSARLVQEAGFPVVYASGGAIARSQGVPDLNLLSLTEVANRVQEIVDAVTVPVVADADSGYGNALNAKRAARAFERAGVAGFHIEDQVFPKRCGHYDDKVIVPVAEFQGKIRAVRDALHDPEVVVIARTDAIGVEGVDGAIERAHAYAEAGADMVFLEAPTSEAQVKEIAQRLPYPKVINMSQGGKTPLVPLATLRELGYALVIVPGDLQRAVIQVMARVLQALRGEGPSAGITDAMASLAERDRIVDTAGHLELHRRYGA